MVEAEVKLCLGHYSKPVYESLLAEVQQGPRKAVINVSLEEGCVKLHVEAKRVNQVRAILNSYLQLIHAAYSTLRG